MGAKRVPSAVLILALAAACGDGGDARRRSDGSPPLPRRGDPAFGAAGHVLVSDREASLDGVIDQLWVGFSGRESWDHFLSLRERLAPFGAPWICGVVVADPRRVLGFYLDPATTVGAEIVATGLQIPLDMLKLDPGRHADRAWCLAGVSVERIEPGRSP
jgi:hypothetical protein